MTMRAAVLLLFLLLGAKEVAACSCAGPSGELRPRAEVKAATAVFIGRAVDREEIRIAVPGTGDIVHYRYTFEVSESWKGVSARRIRVVTGSGGGDCGLIFQSGEYLVFAYRPGFFSRDELTVELCTRTAPVEKAEEHIRKLRAWRRPKTPR